MLYEVLFACRKSHEFKRHCKNDISVEELIFTELYFSAFKPFKLLIQYNDTLKMYTLNLSKYIMLIDFPAAHL